MRTIDMNPESVSVVIPVYNNEAYIAAAVKSVLSQTLPPTEIIVVDDGSTDSTAAALESLRGSIKYLYQQNRGEPSARNRGIRESTGEYIAFLDGDDLWHPSKLELQMNYVREHPDCALVYTDMSTFDENGVIDASVKERLRMSLPSGHIFPALFMTALFGSGSVVFRRECIQKVGYFNEEFLVGCDYEMWLRIARHFEVGAVDHPLLMYRHHASMSTRGLGLKMYKGVPWEVAVLSKILRLYPEAIAELGKTDIGRRMSKPYAGLAYAQFRQNEYKKARPLLRKAIAHWPTNVWYWLLYGTTFLHPAQIAATRKLYRRLSTSCTERTEASEATT
jgi:glycosyltransferase involved in cell wall biosynthesis